jgi:hypothetical protein
MTSKWVEVSIFVVCLTALAVVIYELSNIVV